MQSWLLCWNLLVTTCTDFNLFDLLSNNYLLINNPCLWSAIFKILLGQRNNNGNDDRVFLKRNHFLWIHGPHLNRGFFWSHALAPKPKVLMWSSSIKEGSLCHSVKHVVVCLCWCDKQWVPVTRHKLFPVVRKWALLHGCWCVSDVLLATCWGQRQAGQWRGQRGHRELYSNIIQQNGKHTHTHTLQYRRDEYSVLEKAT